MKPRFVAYNPYLSYAAGSEHFVDSKGRPTFSWLDDAEYGGRNDVEALWHLGRNAYSALPTFGSSTQFDDLYEKHLLIIETLKKQIEFASELKGFVFQNHHGQRFTPDFESYTSSEILHLAWKLIRANAYAGEALRDHFLFACLEEVEEAIGGIRIGGGAIASAIVAADSYASFLAIKSGNATLQQERSDFAMRGAIERHRRDPKQEHKQFIKQCWEEWQSKPTLYRTQSIFATDMLTKVPSDKDGNPVISHDTIVKKWIPEWSKAKK
jgi:hypothetical protein